MLPFLEGGWYLERLCISRTWSVYWSMLTLNSFTISLWIYFRWYWKVEWCFRCMRLPNSNQISFSNSLQRYAPLTGYLSASVMYITWPNSRSLPCQHPLPLRASTSLRKNSSPYPYTPTILHVNSSWRPVSMHSVYFNLLSTSVIDMIYRCSNVPNVRSHIALNTLASSWLNSLMQGNLLFTRFCLVTARLDYWMTRISTSSHYSVLSPSYDF